MRRGEGMGRAGLPHEKAGRPFQQRKPIAPRATTPLDYVLMGLWTFFYAVLTATFRLLKRAEVRERPLRTVSACVAGRGSKRKLDASV